ncbi:MAG: Mrp/NBP35 family ATP-binding protein [Melioribacteraceae bacterium]|nr:Mrp/NBP35 family ATP-binding protein [Melioribacteraceae bacterium]
MDEHEKQIALEEEKIDKTISKIKHRIAVFSGKGGVGKTTVSVNLAAGFQSHGSSAGILDADITGPNVAKMLAIHDDAIVLDGSIIPFEKYGLKVISIASMIKSGQPVIWRGPMRSKVINQFLADVMWGDLDYLIADLPPGTGDEILTIAQKMKPDCAVIVTTPQEVSVIDAERAVNMAKKMEIPYIGIVENMAGFTCPSCGEKIDLFGTGGGEELASKENVHFLGSIPIDINARILGDKGIPVVLHQQDSDMAKTFTGITGLIEDHYKISQQV